MDYQQILSFITVAECQSFTRAAEKLFMSQPGLSRQISLLEAEFDVKLFERDRKLVKLTKEGEVFLKEAYPLLIHKKKLENSLKIIRQEKKPLRLGYSGWFESAYMGTFLKQFSQKHENIDVCVKKTPSVLKNLDDLREQELDAFVSIISNFENLTDLTCEKLIPAHAYLVVRKDLPLAARESVCRDDLRRETFVAMIRDDRPFIADALFAYFSDKDMISHVSKFAYSKTDYFIMVEAGMGLGLVNDLGKAHYASDEHLVFIPVSDYTQFDYCFLWNSRQITPEILLLKDELKEFLTNHFKE